MNIFYEWGIYKLGKTSVKNGFRLAMMDLGLPWWIFRNLAMFKKIKIYLGLKFDCFLVFYLEFSSMSASILFSAGFFFSTATAERLIADFVFRPCITFPSKTIAPLCLFSSWRNFDFVRSFLTPPEWILT